MMKNHKKTVGAMAAASAMLAGYALAGPAPAPAPISGPAPTNDFFQGELHVGYSSDYVFRFADRGENLAEVGLDGAFDLGNGFRINAGAWYGTINEDGWQGMSSLTGPSELDLYAGVGYDFGMVDVEVGYIYYNFYNTPNSFIFPVLSSYLSDTQEVYAQLGVDLPWDVRFATTYYYDFDANDGWYWDFKLSKTFEFTDCVSLKLAVGTAMADGHGWQLSAVSPTGTDDGYQGWYASAALPWQVLDTVTVTPYVRYTDADSDLRTSLGSNGKEMFVGGVSLSVSF